MSSRARIHDTLERLERWLSEHQPAFLAAMRPGATDAELDDLERAIGRQLPEDVRAFYRWRGGTEGGDYQQGPFWQRPLTLDEIRYHYEECCAFAETDWVDLGHPSWWHPAWVPIMSNDNGDFLCVDTAGVWTGAVGQIVRFWHDYESREVEAGSLSDWLRVLVCDLERGRTFATDDRHPYGYPKRHEATEEPVIPESPPVDPIPPRPGFSESVRVGDRVRITGGSFQNMEGGVTRLEAGTWRVMVVVILWGRPLDIELELHQITITERTERSPVLGDWSGCEDPYQLAGFIGFATSVRKLRLFAEACCRNAFGDRPEAAEVLTIIEEYVEGRKPFPALKEAAEDFWYKVEVPSDSPENFSAAIRALVHITSSPTGTLESLAPQMIQLGFGDVALIRDIFPNPFAPPRFDPVWRTADVVALARGIYDERAFERMPILADALQDAGCDNDELLKHCRATDQIHVRGCWALDLCLGLE